MTKQHKDILAVKEEKVFDNPCMDQIEELSIMAYMLGRKQGKRDIVVNILSKIDKKFGELVYSGTKTKMANRHIKEWIQQYL